jgi:hypothetical protein
MNSILTKSLNLYLIIIKITLNFYKVFNFNVIMHAKNLKYRMHLVF